MSPDDKVKIEMTNAEAFYLYLLLGKTTGDFAKSLYDCLENLFDQDQIKLDQIGYEYFAYRDLQNSDFLISKIIQVFFSPEKTEQEKKIEQLEATIAKASEEIKQLKAMK